MPQAGRRRPGPLHEVLHQEAVQHLRCRSKVRNAGSALCSSEKPPEASTQAMLASVSGLQRILARLRYGQTHSGNALVKGGRQPPGSSSESGLPLHVQ